MNEQDRKNLVALLVELDLKETLHELNRYMDNHDMANARRILKVEDAITTLLEYLEG